MMKLEFPTSSWCTPARIESSQTHFQTNVPACGSSKSEDLAGQYFTLMGVSGLFQLSFTQSVKAALMGVINFLSHNSLDY